VCVAFLKAGDERARQLGPIGRARPISIFEHFELQLFVVDETEF